MYNMLLRPRAQCRVKCVVSLLLSLLLCRENKVWEEMDQIGNLLIVVNMGIKVASHSLHILELVLIFTMKLEGNMPLSLYSYFILLLNANKEKLSPLRKWSLRDSHAIQRHILSPGMRPAGPEKWSRRMGSV